jgi:Cft2 family RNA processing exonuclease
MRIDFSQAGIHLPEIGLWLDPAVDCEAAWISHGHGDHARGRHGTVIGTAETLEFYRMRFPGHQARFLPLAYGESMEWGGAWLTAHPSGHILGSAQLLIERRGERVVFTGDLKLRPPLLGQGAEPVRAERLIVESTFGLPIFHFLSREEALERIAGFARECFEQGRTPVFLAHPLGRGQEVLSALGEAGIPAAVHDAIAAFLPVYESRGCRFPDWTPYQDLHLDGRALVAVHGFRRTIEASGRDFRIAYVSGWAALDNARARTGAEELIAYSDHASFEELLALVEASGAREVDVVHGYTEPFAHLLRQRGVEARAQAAPFGPGPPREAGG